MNNLQKIIQKIEQARISFSRHHIVRLVAISKYARSAQIAELYKAGQRAFGENKVQDLELKSQNLENLPIEWHFVGRLQTNKINKLLSLSPFLIHSVHSLDLALDLDKRLKVLGKTQKILLQINSANEDTKQGFSLQEICDKYAQIQETCTNLSLQGIMTIGANTTDAKIVAKSFESTAKIFDTLKPKGAEICSMGMSGDYELAIKNGSNMLRLGSILFDE